jgi:hypothetical protein
LSAQEAEEDGPLYPQLATLYPIEVGDRPIMLETDGGAVVIGRRAREEDEVVDDLISRHGTRNFIKRQALGVEAQPTLNDPKNSVADTGYADARADDAEAAAKAASADKVHNHKNANGNPEEWLANILADYAKKDALPDMSKYVKNADLPDFSTFAKKSDIPSVSGFLKNSEFEYERDAPYYMRYTGPR